MTTKERAAMVRLEDLPNIGRAMAADLRLLGIKQPGDLVGRDPLDLYRALEAATGLRQDPCVLDTFMAVVDFMAGGEARPWWSFTAERKSRHGQLRQPADNRTKHNGS